MLDFLNLHEGTFERSDDSNGFIGNVFRDACQNLGKIAENITHLSVSEIAELVFSLHMNDNYSVYDNVIHDFKDALKNEGLDLLWSKFEQSSNDGKDNYHVKYGLEAVADCKNDVDAFIRACSINGKPHDRDHLSIAERLIWNGSIVWRQTKKVFGKKRRAN